MRERLVDIKTRDGVMNTHVFQPEGDGPYPIIIFYMDAPGVREELCDMCRRIASVGYFTMLPNMFYRRTRHFDFDPRRAHDPSYGGKLQEMWGNVRSLSPELVGEDTRAMLEFAAGEPAASKGKIGVVGHCMSGRYAFAMAGRFPDRVGAAAGFYGARFIALEEKDSPHLTANDIKGEMYFGFAQFDEYAPDAMIAQLEEFLKENKIKARVERYPEAHHGFAFPGREAYHKPSAERHWERLFDMWKRNL
ncbi:MAG: dienelactone hydrolase family protein [Hyphomonadaceae bacterium]